MIWDRGTWEPEVDDVDAALAKGDLKLTLHGTKLGGSWVLVRMRDRQWLLIKHHDKAASNFDIAAADRARRYPADVGGGCRRASATPRQLKRPRKPIESLRRTTLPFSVDEDAACRLDFPKGIHLHDQRGDRRGSSPRRNDK